MTPAMSGKYFLSTRYDLLVRCTGAHPLGSRLVKAYISNTEELSSKKGANEGALNLGIYHIFYDNFS